jgi:Uncharacterized conserved protein
MKKTTIIASLLLIASATFAQTWTVDKAHSRLGFTFKHLMIAELGGTFNSFDAKITSSKSDFTDAVIELTADVNSIDTDNSQRDTHLKSPDFFNTEKHPSFTFKSTSFKKVADKQYKLTGDLTFNGVTKPVTLDVTLNGTTVHPMNKKEMAGFTVNGSIKRSDFGFAPNLPDAMVSDEIKLVASTEFVKG